MPADSTFHPDAAEQWRRASTELQQRLCAGEDCRSEDLLERNPALAADETLAVDLICSEFLLRREQGQPTSPEEWLQRFPRWRQALQRQLWLHSERHLAPFPGGRTGEAVQARPKGGRRWRGRLLLGLVVLLLVLATMGGLLAWHYLDLERPQHALSNRLQAGQPVVLVDEKGPPPAGARIVLGAGTMMQQEGAPTPAFEITTADDCMVELLAHPGVQHYRLDAEVLHGEALGKTSRVGVYFLGSQHHTSRGVEDDCCTLTFNDWYLTSKPAPEAPLTNGLIFLELFGKELGGATTRYPIDQKPFMPAGPGLRPGTQPPWRHLSVDIAADQVSLFCDGKDLFTVDRAKLVGVFQQTVATDRSGKTHFDDPEVHPDFPPDSSLGLWVQRGRAYFRNVVITPLP